MTIEDTNDGCTPSFSNDELEPLPCPFCGDKTVTVRAGSSFRWRVVECLNCGATCGETRAKTIGEADNAGDERRAIEAWNTRSNAAITGRPSGRSDGMWS